MNIWLNNPTEKSMVYAFVVGIESVRGPVYMPSDQVIETPCLTFPAIGVFTAYCVYHDMGPKDGTRIKYNVISLPS